MEVFIMPNTIAENLARLQQAKSDIADAIITKGGTCPSSHGLEEYSNDIGTIPGVVTSYTAAFKPETLYLGYSADNVFGYVRSNSISLANNIRLDYYSDNWTWTVKTLPYISNLFGMQGKFTVDANLINLINQSTSPPSFSLEYDLYISSDGYIDNTYTNGTSTGLTLQIYNSQIINKSTSEYGGIVYMPAKNEHVSTTVDLTTISNYPFFQGTFTSRYFNNVGHGSAKNLNITITNIQLSLNL
jgi:hypothetical protein